MHACCNGVRLHAITSHVGVGCVNVGKTLPRNPWMFKVLLSQTPTLSEVGLAYMLLPSGMVHQASCLLSDLLEQVAIEPCMSCLFDETSVQVLVQPGVCGLEACCC